MINKNLKRLELKNSRITTSVFIILVILSLVFFILNYSSSDAFLASFHDGTDNYYLNDNSKNNNDNEVLAVENPMVIEDNSSSATIVKNKKYEFEAESGIVVKVSPGSKEVLFGKGQDKKLPIASLTKLMTALVVLEKYDLNTKIIIDDKIMSQVGEQGSLKLGEILSVKDLLYISLIESSNRAAYALAEIVGIDNFVYLMNKRAEELGMSNTYFVDSSGLNPNSISTVDDLAKLTEYLYESQPLFKEIISLKEYDLYLNNGIFHHKLINTNQLLVVIPGVVGGKTGFTNEARGCYMIIKRNSNDGTYFINIILGSEDRLSAIKYLINNFNY